MKENCSLNGEHRHHKGDGKAKNGYASHLSNPRHRTVNTIPSRAAVDRPRQESEDVLARQGFPYPAGGAATGRRSVARRR
jgi:hypothetical protein